MREKGFFCIYLPVILLLLLAFNCGTWAQDLPIDRNATKETIHLYQHNIAYVMAWRNAGYKKDGSFEFYVPYPGQSSADDFVQFYKDSRTLFQQDAWKEKLYF